MTQTQKQKKNPPSGLELDDVCFIVSPIGREGSEIHLRFKEVLDYMIKPAIESSSLKLRIIRADDINRTGSFIKDILEHLYGAYIVIVDLTDQNPNVFYELGVRHSISPRTILIAQNLDDIPSDLREYRTIIYNTSAKGGYDFKNKIHEVINDIKKEPQRPDNPVLDRLPNFSEQKNYQLEEEVSNLKAELSKLLSKGTISKDNKSTISNKRSANLIGRVDRILKLKNAESQGILGGQFTRGTGDDKKSFSVPTEQGNFKLYFLLENASSTILGYWYLSIINRKAFDLEEELADIRVLMDRCSLGQEVDMKFIIVTAEDLNEQKETIMKAFTKMKTYISPKNRKHFELELWDSSGLILIEKELGIKISLDN